LPDFSFRVALSRLSVLAVCFVLGCSRTTTSPGHPTQATTLRIAVPITPTTLNPILSSNQIESTLDGLIFDKLVTLDNHGHEVPDLAAQVPTLENGGISKDGMTITYHLRRNVRWQDGAPFTGADVKFSWQQVMNDQNDVVNRTGYDVVRSIDTPDAYTVVLHMKKVFPPEIDTFFAESDTPYDIIPKHLLSGFASLNRVAFNSQPVGTGPYEVVRWTRGQEIMLKANPHYFRGAPHIPRIDVEIIPDENTMQTLMESGGIDLALEVPAIYLNNLRRDSSVVLELPAGPNWEGVVFNTAHPPLDDLRVRQALTYGIDRETLLRDVFYGIGSIATADQTPFSWAYDRALRPISYNPAKAKSLLDAAGWKTGAGGIRYKDGRPLSFVLVYGQGSVGAENTVVAMQQELRSIGVEISLKSFDYSIFYAPIEDGGILNAGKYDLALYAWISGADPNDADQWMCDAVPPNGNNVSRFCSPQLDAAERLALSTFDRATRERAYDAVQSDLEQDAPAAFIVDIPQRNVRVRGLENFTPNGISEGWNAEDWQLVR
jgi:peptide/nickel transport system substrate-binding protein